MASSPDEDHSKEQTTEHIEEIAGEELVDQRSVAQESDNPTLAIVGDTVADGKINLFLKATSDVPIMKKKKWQVDENKTIQWVITFIKRYLKLEDKDTIFLYVSQAFAPAPDQQIKNLYECFGAEGKLVLHYSKTPAWG